MGKDHCPVLAVADNDLGCLPILDYLWQCPQGRVCLILWSQGRLGSDCVHWEWEGNSSLKENGSGDGGQVKAGTHGVG